ncbi:MAG: glycoside hydrolase family 88 protein [Bacteroidales bacterium]|nr:glycoside hydrolase family 88 protein [Bacteroidales bacterium]
MKLKHLMLTLAMIAGFGTTRAQDTTVVPSTWTQVKFNPDVRYSQWVLESQLGNFYSNATKRPFQLFDADGNAVAGTAYDKNTKFDYVPGLVAKATIEARDLYKDFDWSKPWFYTVMNYGTNYTYTDKVNGLADSKLTLDDMNAAKMYFGIEKDLLATAANKSLVNEQIGKVIEIMKRYNSVWAINGSKSTNTIGDAVAGGWFHKPEYVDQMWGDGLYMGSALLAQIINYKGTPSNVTDNDWDLITKQFTISWEQMYNGNNGLLYHAFTANPESAKDAGWAGVEAGTTYHSAAHWGRACGWYFLALVDVLEQMQTANLETTENYKTLKGYLGLLAAGLAKYQDEATGCWYQVLDEKDAPLSGNYLESSCTAIFSAAYLKGVRIGVLDKTTYEPVGEKAYEGCVNNFMMLDAEGQAQLIRCCASAGLGGTAKRSGSREYYITGSDVTQRNTYTEGKVLGGFILAATEYERLHEKVNAPMLSVDLNPSYTAKAGETATLEVKVSGAGSLAYQWRKGTWDSSTLIDGATSATYSPKESGKYFCEVTAGAAAKGMAARAATTIRSSVADVTVENSDAIEPENPVESTNSIIWLFEDSNKSGKFGSGTLVTFKSTDKTYDLVYQSNNTSDKLSTSSATIDGKSYTSMLYMNGATQSNGNRTLTFQTTSSKGQIKVVYASTASGTTEFKDITTSSVIGSITAKTNTAVTSEVLTTSVGNKIQISFKAKTYVYSVEWIPAVNSDLSSSTETSFDGYTLTGNTLSVSHKAVEAGTDGKITINKASGATYTVTNATLDGNVLTYKVPAAGESLAITLKVVSEDKANTATYTINVSTEKDDTPVVIPGVTGIGTISWTNMATTGHNADSDGTVVPATVAMAASGKVVGLATNATAAITGKGTLYRYNGFNAVVSTDKYFEYSYDVTAGHTFTPEKITISWAPNGSKAISFKVYVGTSADNLIELTTLTCSADKTYSTDEIALAGNYTIYRLVPYGKDGGSIILDNVVIAGTYTRPLYTSTETSFGSGTLSGNVLSVVHEASAAGQNQTIAVTPAEGATCEVLSGNATLDGNTLVYTAPAEGQSATITLKVTAEDKMTTAEYLINVNTKISETSLQVLTATFTLEDMQNFGNAGGNNSTVVKDDLQLVAVEGTDGRRVEGQGANDTRGSKIQLTAGLTITPNNGARIRKVRIVTDNNLRHLTASPAQTGEVEQYETTYTYNFSSVADAIQFTNEATTGGNIYVARIIVEYEKGVADGKKTMRASFDKTGITYYINDTDITEPSLSITAATGDVIPVEYCNLTYSSSDEKVAKVDSKTGDLEIVGVGSAAITVSVEPSTDVESYGYVGTEAVYEITIKDYDVPVVNAQDLTVYNTSGVMPQPVITVYVMDGGIPLVLDTKYYSLSYTTLTDPSSIIMSDKMKFMLAGEAGNWKIGSAEMLVEIIPTDEAIKKYHIREVQAEFKVTVVETGGLLVPYFGGVNDARMQISSDAKNPNERDFITPVLYGGVDISTGFTFKYAISSSSSTGAQLKGAKNGVLEAKTGNVILQSGSTAGVVTLTVTATPNTEYSSQYKEITKSIKVEVGEALKRLSSVTITPTEITVPVGAVLTNFNIVVKDENGNIMSEDDYTLQWESTAPGTASIIDRAKGGVQALAAGIANIQVFVKNNNYSDRKAVCVVTVEDNGTFKVDANTPFEKGAELRVEGLTLTLGGWMFPNTVSGSHGTTSENLGSASWGKPTTENKNPLGFTHNISMSSQKNARQEYGSNCQPMSNCIYNAKIEELDYKLIDPMFNVPCSGSYFALTPKTNGTATVYIHQNGVFDSQTTSGKTEYVYRPQRRVFVVDEMGNLVVSTPKMEYPTIWNMGGDNGTKFTCDVLSAGTSNNLYDIAKASGVEGNSDKEKTQNYIVTHFKGLKSFSLDNFKNGVYASLLDPSLTHNQAQATYPNVDAARGWCVLVAAPVSYTFDVKAGKTYYIYNFGSKIGLYGFTFRQDDVVVDEVEYSQTMENSPKLTEENHVASVSIDREFQAGVWAACVLPFSMNRQQVNAVFGNAYDTNNENGTEIMYFDRVEGSTIYFVRHAYNTIVAGKPFLIRPTKDAVISSENMGDYPYVTIEAEGQPAEWGRDNGSGYSWVSTYSPTCFGYGDYYISNTGGVTRMIAEYAQLNGFRGYLKAKTEGAKAKALTVSSSNNVDGDDTATAIEGLVMDSEGNLLEVPASGVVYSLSGQIVTEDAKQLYTLPAGIYVVNGRKYVVK